MVINLSGEDKLMIRKLNREGYAMSAIARNAKIPYHSVRRYCKATGLQKHSSFSDVNRELCWGKRKKRLVATIRKITGGTMNFRHHANQLRALEIGWPDYELSHALILYALEDCPLSTPDILGKIEKKKKAENWKPYQMSDKRFVACVGDLKRNGLVKRVSMTGYGLAWKKMSRVYELTELAKEEIQKIRAGSLRQACKDDDTLAGQPGVRGIKNRRVYRVHLPRTSRDSLEPGFW